MRFSTIATSVAILGAVAMSMPLADSTDTTKTPCGTACPATTVGDTTPCPPCPTDTTDVNLQSQQGEPELTNSAVQPSTSLDATNPGDTDVSPNPGSSTPNGGLALHTTKTGETEDDGSGEEKDDGSGEEEDDPSLQQGTPGGSPANPVTSNCVPTPKSDDNPNGSGDPTNTLDGNPTYSATDSPEDPITFEGAAAAKSFSLIAVLAAAAAMFLA